MPVALVTGSSRGIGRGIAERFGEDGYDVAVNYCSSRDAAEETAERIRNAGADAVVLQADVGDPDAAAELVERTIAKLGGLDHLVNNAGINQHKHTSELSTEEFDRLMRINTDSTFAVSKAAHSHLVDSDDDPSIVNLSSILGFKGAAHEPHYAASKSAILGLTKSHAEEFAPAVRVNAIAPGHIETDMTAAYDGDERADRLDSVPVERFGIPEDVAQAAAYLRDATFVTGETIHVNGGELMR